MNSLERRTRPVVLEAFLVVLGVVLAFAANEWREAKAHREHADLALRSIAEELHANRDAVQASLDYHKGVLGQIYEATEAPDLKVFEKGFIHPAMVLSTAWEAARSTEALSYMDYAKVLTVSRTYEMQDRYELQKAAVSQVIYTELMAKGAHGIAANYRNLAAIIGTFYWREQELVAEYDATLGQIETPRES